MVGVAQLVEHWVVAPVVAGSNPVTHPITAITKEGVLDALFFFALVRNIILCTTSVSYF